MSVTRKSVPLLLLALLVVVCALSFFYRLGQYPLWDPDEGRTGAIAREMVASGNWLTLTFNGAPYHDKPAPYFWLLAGSMMLWGSSEFAVRLPSAVAASLTIAAVFIWSSLSRGWVQGFWAAFMLATSLEFVALGRFGKMDMLFTCFFSLALFSFLLWRQMRSPGGLWVFYFSLALATLTKGPAGFVLPLSIVLVARAWEGKWELLAEMRLLRGLAVVFAVAAPWYVAAALKEPGYIWAFIWEHNVLRFFVSRRGIDHPEPLYFLLGFLLGGFLPWTLFLPLAAVRSWRRLKSGGDGETLLLVVWALTVLVFFSVSRNKLGTYILPCLPPLALLTAGALIGSSPSERASRRAQGWAFAACGVWVAFLLCLPFLSETLLRERYPHYPALDLPWLPTAVFLLPLGWAYLRGRPHWVPALVGGSVLWVIVWFYNAKIVPLSELQSTRSLAHVVQVNGHGVKNLRVLAIRAESFAFYLNHDPTVLRGADLVAAFLRDDTPTVALIKEKHLSEIERSGLVPFFVWSRSPSAWLLVANFPLRSAQVLASLLKP